MAVSYKLYDGSFLGAPDLTASDSAQKITLGTIVKGFDTSTAQYGEAEFRYVKFTGSAAIAAGDFVALDAGGKTCIGASTATKAHQVGLAMAAQALNTTTPLYGWMMIRGIHDGANVTSGVTAGTALGVSATLGRAVATAATVRIDGAWERVSTATGGNVGVVELEWPVSAGNG